MKYSLGLYEKALPDNLSFREKLTIAKESGYDFLEISIDESDFRLDRLNWSKEERLQLIEDTIDVDLPIRSMCLSGHRKYPLGSKDPETRKRSLEIAQKAIDLADDLGVRIIQLAGYDVYYDEGDEETKRLFEEGLQEVVEMASEKAIVLGFETMETEFMDTVEKSMEYVNKINSPYLGVYPDCGNLNNAALKYGHCVLEDIKSGDGKIVAMHLKETVEGKYRNMHFGEGVVNFDEIVKLARDMKINRFVTEFWYLGQEDYKSIVKSQCEFARNLLDKFYI